MLGKFEEGWGFLQPLFAHVAVHGLMTFAIVLAFKPQIAIWCMFFDMTVHFVMDRIKASKRYLGRFKPLTADTAPTATEKQWRENSFFWQTLGLDQAVHHMTHYAIIWALVS
jgi:hypothetical protein